MPSDSSRVPCCTLGIALHELLKIKQKQVENIQKKHLKFF